MYDCWARHCHACKPCLRHHSLDKAHRVPLVKPVKGMCAVEWSIWKVCGHRVATVAACAHISVMVCCAAAGTAFKWCILQLLLTSSTRPVHTPKAGHASAVAGQCMDMSMLALLLEQHAAAAAEPAALMSTLWSPLRL
jgi:hypothetical protein